MMMMVTATNRYQATPSSSRFLSYWTVALASLLFVVTGVSGFPSAPLLAFPTASTITSTRSKSTCPLLHATLEEDTSTRVVGRVLRTALRKYHVKDSKPASRNYTTRKDAQDHIQVTTTGIVSDYNDYRTTALQSTPDRAVSLWTAHDDVLELLKAHGYDQVQPGDLGENISLEGVPFTFFKVGHQYRFSTTQDQPFSQGDVVVLEITERIEPCGSLCKLPYINSDALLKPKDRVQRCKDFLKLLDQQDGLRGWYAKVIQEGVIRPGDIVVKVEDDEQDTP
jgi:MOSC domain-containing protein YiiM